MDPVYSAIYVESVVPDEEEDVPANDTGLPFADAETVWPHLRVRMKDKGEVKADVCGPMCAAIFAAPIRTDDGHTGHPRLLYAECLLTSELTANALMGMACDPKGEVKWFYVPPGAEPDGHMNYAIEPPQEASPQNVRIDLRSVLTTRSLSMPTGHAAVHHVSIIERADVLIMSKDDLGLWAKVRERCTCPSMESWGPALAGRLVDAGVVAPCFGFGWPAGLRAHCYTAEADARFDGLVSEFVLKNGLK